MQRSSSKLADEILVVSAILGDLEAFNELVVRYRPAVVRLALNLVGSQEAEDAAQDAFLLAFKALPSVDDPSKFAAWLMTLTRNRCYRISKQSRNRRAREVPMDLMLLEQFTALQFDSSMETSETVRIALDHVPEPYKLVLQLQYLDEMPLKRIAAFLGLPISTVKWRSFRGKQLMKIQIENLNTMV